MADADGRYAVPHGATGRRRRLDLLAARRAARVSRAESSAIANRVYEDKATDMRPTAAPISSPPR
jgi:hypothetical protein